MARRRHRAGPDKDFSRTDQIRRAADDDYEQYDDEYEDYEEYDDDLARKRAGMGCLIAFLAVLAVVVVVVLFFVFSIKSEIDGNKATATETVVFDVAPSSTGRVIGSQLEEEGLISSASIFRFYTRFNGATNVFQTGRFYLDPGMSYDEIIEVLSQPPPPRDTMMVTFPEGSTVVQFAMVVEEAGMCTAQEFIDAANDLESYSDIDVIARILSEGQDPDTYMPAEGYLAPNTYEFYVDESAENIVRRLYEQFDAEMTDELYARMEERGLSLIETITLASLIEEEAGDPEHQPDVAAVFWNRLKEDLDNTDLDRRTMGSDVTFYYIRDWIARDYGGNYEDVPDNLFYGYYSGDEDERTREGLPAGPISCPGMTAINAALYPNEEMVGVDYYFLTDFYGNYYYARTFAEHEGNIATMERMNAQYEAEEEAGTLEENTEEDAAEE
ncbi:endolytic transglycosylase MltG [Ruminococcaceae bacterium OttesenSCG-928-I18]|nr:endolytic transglycosylase MltG [Ruminococcaceae bacterium OttesenSCG-928-I18]